MFILHILNELQQKYNKADSVITVNILNSLMSTSILNTCTYF